MKIADMLNTDVSDLGSVLKCPTCGDEHAHIREVRVTNTTLDGYDVDEVVTVSRGSLHRRSGERDERIDMRQGSIELVIDGECQCPPYHVAFGEHKGQVFVRWEPVTD